MKYSTRFHASKQVICISKSSCIMRGINRKRTDFMGLAQLIQEKYHALTKSEKRIADYLLKIKNRLCIRQ